MSDEPRRGPGTPTDPSGESTSSDGQARDATAGGDGAPSMPPDDANEPDGAEAGDQRPAILQETSFVVEEGILHRVCRTGAILLNKLFFSSAILWGIWLLVAASQGLQDCAGGLAPVGNNSSQELSVVNDGTCSVLLTTTSKFLGAMTVLSFLGSITLGLLGLAIGKRVLETSRAQDEVGAEERAGDGDGPSDAVASDADPAAPQDPAERDP